MNRAGILAAAFLTVITVATASSAAVARDSNEHTVRFRPVLAEFRRGLAADVPDAATEGSACEHVTLLLADGVPSTTPSRDDVARRCVVLPAADDPATVLLLGDAFVTGRKIVDARSDFQEGAGYVVTVTLEPSGRRAFDRAARRQFPLPPPRNQLAVVIDGRVVVTPQFVESRFPDRAVQISGSFSRAEAIRIARNVNEARLSR